MKIIIPDDYQDVVDRLSCFSLLAGHDITRYREPAADLDQLVERLHPAEVIVAIREPIMTVLSDRVRGMMQGERFVPALRDYGIGAQILLDLGVRDMVLLSNTERTIVALEGYGLTVTDRRPIDVPET